LMLLTLFALRSFSIIPPTLDFVLSFFLPPLFPLTLLLDFTQRRFGFRHLCRDETRCARQQIGLLFLQRRHGPT
jgi:hypothetical protein